MKAVGDVAAIEIVTMAMTDGNQAGWLSKIIFYKTASIFISE